MKIKNLYLSMMRDYIVFGFLSIFVIIAAMVVIQITTTKENKPEEVPLISADLMINPDYEKIQAADVIKLAGWIEVINEDNKVVFIKGQKKDAIYHYSRMELFKYFQQHIEEKKYLTSIAPFKAHNGETYLLLVKVPMSSLSLENMLFSSMYEGIRSKFILSILKIMFIFLLLFIISIMLYSRYTSKKIIKPLSQINEGIQEMTRGSFDTRLNIQAQEEFTQIGEAFNYMADQLESEKRQRERLEKSKQRMIVDISHDLKTPITTIQGYAKALQEGVVKDETKKQQYLKLIYNKSIRVTELIDTLFEFSKLNDADYKLLPEETDFAEFVRQIVVEHYSEIQDKGLILELEIPDKDIMLKIDKNHMARAISNILTNAIKYNSAQTILRISLFETDRTVVLELADNGEGIPEGIKATIFDAFTRGDEARQSNGGTGLGLAITKKIIEKHSGTIEIEETHKEHTIFKITFPKP